MTQHRGKLETVCVYCGSGAGQNPAFAEAARTLGQALAEADTQLVYGGGGLGLMGIVARSVLEHGGHVTGIMPEFLHDRERMLEQVRQLVVDASVTTASGKRLPILADSLCVHGDNPEGVRAIEDIRALVRQSRR